MKGKFHCQKYCQEKSATLNDGCLLHDLTSPIPLLHVISPCPCSYTTITREGSQLHDLISLVPLLHVVSPCPCPCSYTTITREKSLNEKKIVPQTKMGEMNVEKGDQGDHPLLLYYHANQEVLSSLLLTSTHVFPSESCGSSIYGIFTNQFCLLVFK